MVVASGALAGVGCASDRTQQPAGRTLPPVQHPVIAALAVTPSGTVRYGELASGEIRDRGSSRVLARVPVSHRGQRGLLGLAAADDGRTFTAATEPGGRLVVDRVLPVPRVRVWTGPPSVALGNGGHLALLPSGQLVLGIGDHGHPSRINDPRSLDGKLVSLDPDGRATQTPRILSGGWHNPFAFDVTPGGHVIVADNAPGRLAERIGPGDRAGRRQRLSGPTAPSGLAVLSPTEVAVCGVVSGRLDRYRFRAGRWRKAGRIAGCRYGVARLPSGALLVSTDTGLQEVQP